jgi:DNA ligase (NAD+)
VVKPEGEVAVYCDNVACPARLVRQVEYFASRGAMDIEGFGSKLAVLFVEEGLIQDVADFYHLDRDQILALEGFDQKRTDNLLAAIEASKDRPLRRVIAALGIRGVGGTVAGLLSSHYGAIDPLMAATQEELEELEGIGPVLAENVVDFFGRSRHQEIVEKLRRAGVRLADEPPEDGEKTGALRLDGLTFVITGTLPSMSRREATALIKEHGGRVTGSVSGNTDYLLVGGNPGGTKYNKAESLQVPMIDEATLREMIDESAETTSGGAAQPGLF